MRLLLAVAVGFAAVAYAQDRILPPLRVRDVTPRMTEVRHLPDAGCTVTAFASVDAPSIEVPYTSAERAWNAAACSAVRVANLRSSLLDRGAGDGGLP